MALDFLGPYCGRHRYGDPDMGWQPHIEAEGIEYAHGHDYGAMHFWENDDVKLTDPCLIVPRGNSERS